MPLQRKSQAAAIAYKTAGKAKNAAVAGADNGYSPALLGEDKQKWVHVPDVPVFDAHHGEEEGLDIDFTVTVLKKIVEQNNQRIAAGDSVPVTHGHTNEANEPPVLGWANNFKMGKHNGKHAILCDMQFTPENHEKVKTLSAGMRFPRRSIELWDDYVIDPIALEDKPILDTIALLGAERPARDLGLGQNLKKSTSKKYRYTLTEETGMNPEDMKTILDALTSLPEWQYLSECANKKTPLEGEAEQANFEAEEEEEDKTLMEDEKDDEVAPAKLRMQRDQLKRKFSKLQSEFAAKEEASKQEIKTLFSKVAELERKERLAARKNDLMQLEAEGFAFDLAEELETVADMEPARFSKHKASIKRNYRKAPININVKPALPPGEGRLSADPSQVFKDALAKAAKKEIK